MREIKFRAWDKKEGMSNFPISINFNTDGHINGVAFFGIGQIIGSNDLQWMQYTGLKDKNGKEIYEGDIVKTEGQVNSEIVWHFNRWMHKYLGIGRFNWEILKKNKMEVIGNIYDNKDLLK